MSREGSLEAPTRHDSIGATPISPMPRSSTPRCGASSTSVMAAGGASISAIRFRACSTLIDGSPSGEVEGVKSEDFAAVVEACTLCDMCFMTKCPYVPPHPFNLDFPHLMLRYRAAEAQAGKTNFIARQLAEMDRNGTLAQPVSPLANCREQPQERGCARVDAGHARYRCACANCRNSTAGLSCLPTAATLLVPTCRRRLTRPNRKAAFFATCFVNYNKPETGMAARAVLNHIGVETRVAYPGCCGMPFLEQAELERVAQNAAKVSGELVKLIDEGYDIVALTASCGLMFKFEWPLIVPENEDVKRLASATFDIDEYVVDDREKARPARRPQKPA